MGPAPPGAVASAWSPSTATSMGSSPTGAGVEGREGTAGRGPAGPSLKMAVWSLRQFQQWGGEVSQQDRTGLLFPLRGQVGF